MTGHEFVPRGPLAAEAARLRGARVRRRAWLLAATAPVVVGALVVGVRITSVAPVAAAAREDFDAGRLTEAADSYEGQTALNLVEPWKAHFNEGTARTADVAAGGPSSAYGAADALHEAYDLASEEPPEVRCLVQTNLSLAYEAMGDEEGRLAAEYATELEALEAALAARAAGDPYDEEAIDPYGDGDELDPDELRADVQSWYEWAEGSYAYGKSVRTWPDCAAAEQTPQQEEQSAGAQARLAEKAAEAERHQPDHEEPTPTPTPSPAPTALTAEEQAEAERQQRLREANGEAAESADQEQQENRSLWGGEDGQGPAPTRNW